VNPLGGFSAVDESQDFHPVRASAVFRPFDDAGDGFVLPFGNACGTDFETVYMQAGNEQACNTELFSRSKGDTWGLFTIAERGIEDFDITIVPGFCFHFLSVSF